MLGALDTRQPTDQPSRTRAPICIRVNGDPEGIKEPDGVLWCSVLSLRFSIRGLLPLYSDTTRTFGRGRPWREASMYVPTGTHVAISGSRVFDKGTG